MRRASLPLMFALAALCGGGPATTQVAGPSTDALVAQLDADDWQARDAAADQLAARGEAVRAAVSDAAAHAASPEVRSRAAAVIARLDRLATDRPTRVTLHLDHATPREALLALGQQAGVVLRPYPDTLWAVPGPPVPRIDLDVVDQPFWTVMDAVCRKVGGEVRPLPLQADELTVMAGPGEGPLAGPHGSDGRVIVVAKAYDRSRHVSYTADRGRPDVDQLSVMILFDPKLHVSHDGDVTVKLTEATDDKGQSLLPTTAPNAGPIVLPRVGGGVMLLARTASGTGPLRQRTIDLNPAASSGSRLSTLKGTLTASIVTRFDTAVIDDVVAAAKAGPTVRTVGLYTLTLTSGEAASDGTVTCTVDVRSAAAPLTYSFTPTLRFEDASEQPIPGERLRRSLAGDGRMTFTAKLKGDAPIHGPVRLVWSVPARTEPLTVPFEFHDLPLPPA